MVSENSASIFNTLSDLPSQLVDGPAVLGEAMRLAQETLDAQRHKHLAYIFNEQAQLNANNGHQHNTNSSHQLNMNLNKVKLKFEISLFLKIFSCHLMPF